MRLHLIIFFSVVLAVSSATMAVSQTARDAAVMVTPEFPDTGSSSAEVWWNPAGIPDSTTVQTVLLPEGLTSVFRTYTNGAAWMTPIPANHPTVEQRFFQPVSVNGVPLLSTGYVRSGLARTGWQFPKRRVVVICDNGVAAALQPELERLTDDLQREGWHTSLRSVPTLSTVASVKSVIYEELRNPLLQWARSPLHVILVGAIPYAMSGSYSTVGAIPNPDFHPEHGGAWSSDAYYADTETSPGVDAEYQWTDEFTDISDPAVAFRPENRNVPLDGKFDQSLLPSDLELCVGRIDMRDLPAFGTSTTDRTREFDLVRAYLDRNHAYRVRDFVAPMRAIVDDNFGLFSRVDKDTQYRITEAFAASGWRSFSAIVGADSVLEGDWIPDKNSTRRSLDTFPALLAYGCGGGGFDHCDFVTNTEELTQYSMKAVFTLMFGSYFADVHSTNNVMRAALANDGWILTAGWSGRPHWFLHPLANSNTIGECQRLSANNNGTYIGSYYQELETGVFGPLLLGERNIHVMLLGDPTLTLQGPTIPGVISLSRSSEGGLLSSVTWSRSPEHRPEKGSEVAYLIESGTAVDGIYNVIDTIAPFNEDETTAVVDIPRGHYQIRVRPYFVARGRLAPLPGRGVVGTFPILSVQEQQAPYHQHLSTLWTVFDVLGRRLATTYGSLDDVKSRLPSMGIGRAMVLLQNGLGSTILVAIPQ